MSLTSVRTETTAGRVVRVRRAGGCKGPLAPARRPANFGSFPQPLGWPPRILLIKSMSILTAMGGVRGRLTPLCLSPASRPCLAVCGRVSRADRLRPDPALTGRDRRPINLAGPPVVRACQPPEEETTMRAQRLTIAQRQEVFHALVLTQDAGRIAVTQS